MGGTKKTIKDVVAENVDRLIELSGLSEDALADKGYTADKNFNNARNGRNTTLETLEGIARTFGLQTWELLVPDLDVDKARLEGAELMAAYAKAQQHIQLAIQVMLGLRKAKPDEAADEK